MITFPCEHCARKLKVKDELAGKKGRCPHCGKSMRVPALAPLMDAPTLPPPPRSSSPLRAVLDAPTLPPAVAGAGLTAGAHDTAGAGREPAAHDLIDFLAPPQAPDELGRLGPYRILQVLGAGGMGVVYKAEDTHLERTVALKAILPSLGAGAEVRQRFLREARAAAAVKHDHIVTIYQVGEDRGVPFLAMEFLEGEPLDRRLQRENRLPLAEVLRIGRESADALAAAHERGLIHRDVKPANIWLEGPRRRVKLLDFGLARATSGDQHLTQQGVIMGTPAYMAPEQARGDPVDHRADLFSLGVVLYQLSTGELPFQGADSISTLVAVATEQPTAPRVRNPQTPEELSELILRLLAKRPDDRPQTARAVVQDLERIESIQATSHPETTSDEPPRYPQAILVGSDPSLLEAETQALPAIPVAPLPPAKPPLPPPPALPAARRKRLVPIAAGLLLVVGAGLLLLAWSRWSGPTGPGPSISAPRSDVPFDGPADAPPVVELGRLDNNQTVRALAISPDNKVLAVGGSKETVELWDLMTGKKLTDLEDHPRGVFSLAFSPDGQTLAAGCFKHIKLWDMNRRTERTTLKGNEGEVFAVAFSPDGRLLAAAAQGSARVYDLAGDELRWRFVNQSLRPIVPRHGETMVWWGRDRVFLWDLTRPAGPLPLKGEITSRSTNLKDGGGFPLSNTAALRYSRDGKILALGYDDSRIRLWDPVAGKRIGELDGHTEGVIMLSFSPDGGTLLSSSKDRTLILWDLEKKKERATLRGGKDERLHWGYFNPWGNWLLTYDEKDPRLLLRDGTGKPVGRLPVNQSEVVLAMRSPNGGLLAVLTKDRVLKLYRMSRIIESVARGVSISALPARDRGRRGDLSVG